MIDQEILLELGRDKKSGLQLMVSAIDNNDMPNISKSRRNNFVIRKC